MMSLRKEAWNTRVMVKISVLSVISFILMFFEVPLAFMVPTFIKIDISDLPALLGTFAMGPMAGVMIELLKNVLNVLLEGTTTGGVGELANFVVGAALVYTAGAIYKKDKSFRGSIIGLIAGTIVMTIVITFANYYIMFPFYAKLFGMPIEKLVEMGSVINASITDLKTMMIYSIVPFNLLKGAVLTFLTIIVYKRLSPILHS